MAYHLAGMKPQFGDKSAKRCLPFAPRRWGHCSNLCFLASGTEPIPHADSVGIILAAAPHRAGNKCPMIYRMSGVKYIFFPISVLIGILSGKLLFSSLVAGCVSSMLKHLQVTELNQSLMLLHAEMWRGPFGMFLGFCLFLDCINKNFCLSWSICCHCCFADFALPTGNQSGKFWISLPKSNSHSFEYIRTIPLCRQIFRLQLYTQKKAGTLRLEIQTKRSNNVEKRTNLSCADQTREPL